MIADFWGCYFFLEVNERGSLIFLEVKKRGSLIFWKQRRSRSRSSADCPVCPILAADFIAQHHVLGASCSARCMPARSSATLVARHRALPTHLLGMLARHHMLPARPRPRLLDAVPLPHVSARYRILDCTPARSATSS